MFEREFPNLNSEGYQVTSPQTWSYNCIAWAAGDNTKFWWPDNSYICYWPEGLPRETTLKIFIQMFGQFNYIVCDTSDKEDGFEKIAIYINNDGVTHAARQLSSGRWTSKLGSNHDIEHTIAGLDGPEYGKVGQIMKRRIIGS